MKDFEAVKQESFPFFWQIVRKNKRRIPDKLKGNFTTQTEATQFLKRVLEEGEYGSQSDTSGD